jgi:type IV secretory pathway VirB2 component (pilin)
MRRRSSGIDRRALAVVSLLVLAGFLLAPHPSFAAVSVGGGLPYETWLASLRNSVTGPVAFTISLIGLIVAGAVLIFGGELNAFFRTLIFLVLVMALIISSQNMLTNFFGVGAVIGPETAQACVLAPAARSVPSRSEAR